MSNLETLQKQNGIASLGEKENVWEQIEQIRALFAPTLTEKEFMFFVQLGKSLGANPFLREIWAVKYDPKQPAQIFLGRDFYRRKAQQLPNYNGHIVDAVYENDEFVVENGKPRHSYNLKNRGRLIGAYCVVHRKDTGNPYFVYVDLDEYDKGFSNWRVMPATMIKKVAEAQALRGAFQGVFAGTYDESEQWSQQEVVQKEDHTDLPPAPECSQPATDTETLIPVPKETEKTEILKELEKHGFSVAQGKNSSDYYVAGNSYGKPLIQRLLKKNFQFVTKKDGQEIYKLNIA
jgi:phage recombination protein Bet